MLKNNNLGSYFDEEYKNLFKNQFSSYKLTSKS